MNEDINNAKQTKLSIIIHKQKAPGPLHRRFLDGVLPFLDVTFFFFFFSISKRESLITKVHRQTLNVISLFCLNEY